MVEGNRVPGQNHSNLVRGLRRMSLQYMSHAGLQAMLHGE